VDKSSARKRSNGEETLVTEVETKVARKLKAQRDAANGIWFGLGAMGLIGWSVVIPTLLGTALGTWLDQNHPGKHSWTLALLVAGLTLGCFNAWQWMARQGRAMKETSEDDDR
jgi:ATP synthase protein I